MSNIMKTIAALGVVAGLGVAALPLSSYAVESGPVTVRAEVNTTIGVKASKTLVDLGTITAGADPATGEVDVTVTASGSAYTLTILDADNDTNMVNTSGTGTIAAGNPTNGTAAWGYRTAKTGAFKAVPQHNATGATLTNAQIATNTTNPLVSGSATTTVYFGVSAASETPAGTYEDEVVFQATATN